MRLISEFPQTARVQLVNGERVSRKKGGFKSLPHRHQAGGSMGKDQDSTCHIWGIILRHRIELLELACIPIHQARSQIYILIINSYLHKFKEFIDDLKLLSVLQRLGICYLGNQEPDIFTHPGSEITIKCR